MSGVSNGGTGFSWVVQCPRCGGDTALDPAGARWCQNHFCQYVWFPPRTWKPAQEDVGAG